LNDQKNVRKPTSNKSKALGNTGLYGGAFIMLLSLIIQVFDFSGSSIGDPTKLFWGGVLLIVAGFAASRIL
jgi:hypothetical protein